MLLERPFLSTAKAMMYFRSGKPIIQYKDEYSTYNICVEACDAAMEEATYKLKVKKAKE